MNQYFQKCCGKFYNSWFCGLFLGSVIDKYMSNNGSTGGKDVACEKISIKFAKIRTKSRLNRYIAAYRSVFEWNFSVKIENM